MDLQVLEEAETEAKLDESVMDEDVIQKENKIYDIRRQKIRLEMSLAATKKTTLLLKIETKVKSALDRFEYASDSLRASSALKIQTIEDQAARENAHHQMELLHINTEQQNHANSHVMRRRDRQVFHGRDIAQAEEDLIHNVQASETEDPLSDDEDAEEEEGAEHEHDEDDA